MNKALVLLMALTPGLAAATVQVQMRQLEPRPGVVLQPGQQVWVRWSARVPADDRGCEQELMLSLDGGATNTLRVTAMLSPKVREILWTVPDVASDRAVLDLRYGCDRTIIEPPTDVPQFPQRQAQFSIGGKGAKAGFESVRLAPLPADVLEPGDTLTVAWTSSVRKLDFYEVLVSYDRGAHFHALGTTVDLEYEWTAPAMFGGATFQVVAHRTDGTTLATYLPAREHVKVQPAE